MSADWIEKPNVSELNSERAIKFSKAIECLGL